MRRDSKAFRERFLRWKAGEAVYDAGKPIEHYADGTEPDALRTAAPIRNLYRLTVLDLNKAIEAIRRTNTAQVSTDTRSATERLRVNKQAAIDREQYRKELLKQKNEEAFWNLVNLTSPSTYIGLAIGQPIEGVAALATDALAFGGLGAFKSGVKSVMNAVGRAGNTVENIINNKGFALTSPSRKIVTWVGKGLGSKISLEDAGNGWLRPSYIQSKTPGTGRKLYDAAINTAKRNGYKGIESGFDLLSAPKTYRTWEHYPSRIYLGNYGKHSNQNVIRAPYIGNNVNTPEALLNATKNNIEVIFNNAPVYGLTTPSEEVTTFNLPKFLLKKDYEEIPIGLSSSEPLIARDTPEITAENAASITPEQWTAAQDAAIARGDWAEAQRLRDLHFKVNAPNTTAVNELGDPIHNYHGTTNTFTAFDPQKIGSTTGDKSGFFFTDNKSAADFYSHETGSAWNNLKLMLGLYKGHKPQVYDVYLNTTKPMITDFHGGADKVGREVLAKEAIKNGNDANILQNIIDGPPALSHNVTIMRNPKHIKSADAITYDDKGVRIPLGERDNFNINDIRYNIRNVSGQEINNAINRGFTERFAQQFHQFPQEVENILTNQIVPRRLRMLKRNQPTDGAQKIEDFVKHNGEVDFSTVSGLKTAKEQGWTFEEVQDYMQYKDYQSTLNETLSNGYTQYPLDAWNARHPAPDKNTLITGVYDETTDKIELPEGFNTWDAAHETRHRMLIKAPTIHIEENILHNAYDYNLRDTEFGKRIYEKELETVNLELRDALLRENKAGNMSLNIQDALLGSDVWYSDDHILHTLLRTNSYGEHIVENINKRIEQIKKSILNKGLIPGTKEFDDEVSAVKHSIVENIRYAVQAVGVAAAAVTLNNK